MEAMNNAKMVWARLEIWVPIRAEFARKAKKIGLEIKSDAVNWQQERDGIVTWCTATGRV